MTSVNSHVLNLALTSLFLNVMISSSTIQINVKTDILNDTDFNKCLSLILKQNIPCNALISLIFEKTDVNKLIEDISKDQCFSVLTRTFHNKNWMIWNTFYMIIAENSTELSTGLLELRKDILWNPAAKFILVIKNVMAMQELFEQFVKFKLYDILLINKKHDSTYIYSYHPFNNSCGDQVQEIIHLGNCLETNDFKHPSANDFRMARNCRVKAIKFQEKPHKKVGLRQQSLTIPTVEQYVFDTYAKYSKFTIDYKVIQTEKDYGIVLPNGTATGLLRYLGNDIAEVAIGSTVLIMNRANLFDFIYGFNYGSFKLYTSSLGSEMWKKVYKEFGPETYLIIFIFYGLIIAVFIVFLKTTPEVPLNYTYLVVKLWGFFYLGNGTQPYPKIKRLRFLTLCWIWFTFFISSFYNSDMYGQITGHVQRVRQIEPNKLNSIPYKPCIPKVIRTFFHFAYNEDLPESYDATSCHSIDGALDTTANGEDLYTVQMKPSYTEREMDFIDKEGNRKLDPWDFGGDFSLCFYISKGLPFKDKLMRHAQYMYEAGLVDHYKERMTPPKGAVARRKQGVSRPFVLGDFRVHFLILFGGSIISAFAFVMEILYNRKKSLPR